MLKVENLCKKFVMHIRDGAIIDGFENVSFTAGPGKLIALTGPSGIGKSSLLKSIYRTYKVTSGSIWYTTSDGAKIDLVKADDNEILALRHAEIGYISQFFSVIPRVSALDILIGNLTKLGHKTEDARALSKYYLECVGLPDTLWNMYPATFSGGEKQRLNIIHALIKKPRFLLLDEPTASLDAGSKNRVCELILKLKAEGTAMVGVFHDQDALHALSDYRYDLGVHKIVPV